MNRHWPLAAIIVTYLVLGSFLAMRMPAWQTPDEPAHYNVTRQMVQTGSVPVIEAEDWNVKLVPIGPTQRDVAVDRLTYEDHQPPLFYALAAPVYGIAGGDLVAMRLFSLLIGAATIVFAYLTVLAIFPAQPALAAFTAAFVGLLPQHLFMMAGFNNDSLAEALIALALWQSVRLIRPDGAISRGQEVALAVTVGLCFWTKATAYLALPIAVFALWRTGWASTEARRAVWPRLIRLGLIAGLIGLPWWIHNLQMYGGLDFLGLTRHNEVVVGQPTTAEWLAQFGPFGVLARLLRTTFQSFWGQFGWMSILLPNWLYLLFLTATAASAGLFLAWWASARRARRSLGPGALSEAQSRQLTLLALLALLTLLAFFWYNLQFVQHQGRYLYPALIPIGLAAALGWSWLAARWPVAARWVWVAPAVLLIGINVYALFRVALPQMGA